MPATNSTATEADVPILEPSPALEPSPLPAQFLGTETGVLIGLRADEREGDYGSPSEYRTLWLSDEGGGESFEPLQFDGVIVTPRTKDDPRHQLWTFKPVFYETPTDQIRAIAASPTMEPIVTVDDPDENVILNERLTYVGEDMVSLKVEAAYWAGNGNAYSQSAWVKRFDQLGRSKRYDGFSTKWDDSAHLRIQDALGDKLTAEYTGEATTGEMEAELGGLKVALPLGDNWIIERDGHLWTPKIVGLVDYPGSAYAAVALPSRLLDVAQPIEETPNWTAVMLTQSGVKDTFLSDERDYIVIQTADSLLLYAYKDDAPVGEPIWTLKLMPGETVVMCRWFAGDEKPKWSEQFRNAYSVR
ncbi:MAG: hypothetical protein J7559_18010 [Cohnella sp.]|nr:hypothetical protein [Cohnella sp.]